MRKKFHKNNARLTAILLAVVMGLSGPASGIQAHATEAGEVVTEVQDAEEQVDVQELEESTEEVVEAVEEATEELPAEEAEAVEEEILEEEEGIEALAEETVDKTNLDKADQSELNRNYSIYPKPQKAIQYKDKGFVLAKEMNVVFGSKIDEATKNRLTEVLNLKNRTQNKVDEVDVKVCNIIIGTYDSNDEASKYIKENYEFDASIFSKSGAYFMEAKDGDIVILGKDTDGAFYALTSLKHIFSQMEGLTIRNFAIEDYADMPIRGFIEGYYGIPWSNEDRMSLMKFGGEFKMTSYMFAPKDDPYHKGRNWRTLYPEDRLAEIKTMVDVGNASKCRFVWTVHPFDGTFKPETEEKDIQDVLNKFEQLYSIGVRQFGVLGDDVGALPRQTVINLMKRVSAWAKEKGDVYDTVFCPAGYNHSWQGDYSEITEYDAGFPSDVQIFWTGEAVCQPIEQKTLDHFKHNRDGNRRSPLFWLNWPVNDINHSRMLMGSGVNLLQNINVDDIAGAVTNPMQEAEASKVALYAVADYTWNVSGYDANTSWEASFPYVDPDAADALHTLAKHMSNPQPNGHGLVRPESVELKPILDAYKAVMDSDDAAAIKEKGRAVIAEMNTIINACDAFNALSKNENLKDELKPFIASLKDLCQSIVYYVEAKNSLIANKDSEAFDYYTRGTTALDASKTYAKPMISGKPEIVDPGSTEIIPFAEEMQKKLSGPVTGYIFDENDAVEMTASSSFDGSWWSGDASKIIDGNVDTYAWANRGSRVGDYYEVRFSKPITVYGMNTVNGTKDKGGDTFKRAKFQYQTDASSDWKDVPNGATEERPAQASVSGIELFNVVAVRYTNTEADGNWASMREFNVLLEPADAVVFDKEVIRTTDGWGVYNGAEKNIIDGDESTYCWFNVRQGKSPANTTIPGDFIGVKLSAPIILGKIKVSLGKNDSDNDRFGKYDLEYSMDGTNWTVAQANCTSATTEVDLSELNVQAQYVRVKNVENKGAWVAIREFDVQSKVFFNAKAYTNVEDLASYKGNVKDDYAELAPSNVDGGRSDITLNKGDYIGLKLKRVHELDDVTVDLAVKSGSESNLRYQTSENGLEWYDLYGNTESVDASVTITPSSSYTSWYYSNIANITDGDPGTHAWAYGYEKEGAYYQLSFDKPSTVCGISVLNYTSDRKQDAFKRGKLQYQVSGSSNWVDVKGGATTSDYQEKVEVSDISLSNVVGLRYTCTTAGNRWVAMREFNVEFGAEEVPVSTEINKNARYIRVINVGNAAVTFDINSFRVDTNEYTGKSLLEHSFASIQNFDNLFDKNRSTETILGNRTTKGQQFVVDLGREIDFKTFKVVALDGSTDYPRHGKFSISTDKVNWEPIMLLGNQDGPNPGEAEGKDSIYDSLDVHETSFNTREVRDINKTGRYLKYEVTYSNVGTYWLRFTELEINEGEYLPTVNDPTFTGETKDIENGRFEYLTDRNMKTSFIPDRDSGSLSYKVSVEDNVNKLKIVQAAGVISYATVEVRVFNKNNQEEWLELGLLSQIINEFVIPKDNKLVEVKISWENVVPKISEMMLGTADVNNVDKTALEKALDESENNDTSKWTMDNIFANMATSSAAFSVLVSDYITQSAVDNAVIALEASIAKANSEPKADMTALYAAQKSVEKDASAYKSTSWKKYSTAVSNLNAAIAKGEEGNLTAAEAENVLSAYNAAKAGLEKKVVEE